MNLQEDNLEQYRKLIEHKLGLGMHATFVPSKKEPVYNWLYYKEGFSKGLVFHVIDMFGLKEGTVLDPFCGCGTTISVARKLNRKYIGIDISRTACDVMKKRIGRNAQVVGGESEKELRNMEPHEFARLIIVEKLRGTINPRKTGDMGVDGWAEFMTVPVQVKRWGHKVGRPEIDKFLTAVKRENKEKGMIVAFEFSKDCYEEVERIKNIEKVEIQLKEVKELFV